MINNFFKDRKFNCLLCLNGSLPDKDWFDVFVNKYNNPKIVACDGAANALSNLCIVPDIIVGDLDSYNTTINLKTVSEKKPEIVQIIDQDKTDFEKSIEEIIKRNLPPVFVTGIGGGDVDHTIYNMKILSEFGDAISIVGHSLCPTTKDEQYILPIYKQISLKLPIFTTISIIPFSKAKISTKGLRWNLTQKEIDLDGSISIRNHNIEELVSLNVFYGRVLLILKYNLYKNLN